MNEDQVKILIKKSALKTTENFTDSLMEQIEAKSAPQVQPVFPAIKGVFLIIGLLVMLLSFLLFYTNFSFLSEIEIIGNAHRTKLFAVLLFSVLFGVNHLLKIQHTSKNLFND
ncbi:hypothetical protein [Yeosuana sp.]|uniref:hypothetical protein n=1 Tax=Yeosuana sp. TaxID=2529388 RepID=UPI004049EFD3